MENTTDIVNTNEKYTYDKLQTDIRELKARYPFLQIETIGESVRGRQIQSMRIGSGRNEVMYSGSIHANEWITSLILMKFVEDFCIAYIRNEEIFDYSAKQIFENTSIYIIPMINPDGIELVNGNVREGTAEYEHYKKIADNFPSIRFPDGWKANFNGVDLKIYQPLPLHTYLLHYASS